MIIDVDVDFMNGIWGTGILEMLEMFLGISLGHDAGWGCSTRSVGGGAGVLEKIQFSMKSTKETKSC
jgi:hypothetical protein